MRSTDRPDREGFTLVELMIVVALVGLVLASSHLLFIQVGDAHERIAREAVAGDARFAGQRALRAIVRNAETTTDSLERFSGDAGAARFVTWCAGTGGWLERCTVRLSLSYHDDSTWIVGSRGDSLRDTVALFRTRGMGVFRYLDRASRDTTWLQSWGTSILLPGAVALVTERDTIAFPTGDGND